MAGASGLAVNQRLVVRIANCQGVSERKPGDEAHAALTKRGAYGLPDVVLLSEVAWLDAHMVARAHGWVAVQHGTRGSAEAGVAVMSRLTPAKPLRPVIGSIATREGGGIRQRPLVGAKIAGLQFWSGHAPPPRSPIARAAYIARARACRGLVAADWNRDPKWMRRTSLRKYRNVGVLGVLVPRRWKASVANPVNIGSDHPAVDVELHIPVR